VMTTKYCIQYQLGGCPKVERHIMSPCAEPLNLVDESGQRLRLKFDCKACIMEVIYE
jgi:hypothetical protein